MLDLLHLPLKDIRPLHDLVVLFHVGRQLPQPVFDQRRRFLLLRPRPPVLEHARKNADENRRARMYTSPLGSVMTPYFPL